MMVKWMKLGEVCTFKRGRTITAKDAVEGSVPVIAGGQTPSYYHNEGNRTGESITIAGSGAYAGFVAYWNQPIYVSDAFTVDPSERILHKYVFHWLKMNQQRVFEAQKGAGVPHVHGKDIAGFEIPVPSLAEQTRIVGILDTFTDSIENLKQLIAERRKQYEHYRDQLLDNGKYEKKQIGDLFVFKNGLNKEKHFFGQGNPIVNYTDVYHNNRITIDLLKGRVTLDNNEIERYRVQRGDVFFTRTSETQEEIGYAAVLLDNIENCTFSGFLLRARPITDLLLPEYCSHCFSTHQIRKQIVKSSTYTTRALTNGTSLSKICIPVPTLQEQSHFVSILNTFEASIANLEALLKEREKQYEYYRNKLLTFE